MHFIVWNNGSAKDQPTGFFVEVTDNKRRYHARVPDGFRIPDNLHLQHFARSYAEWSVDKSDRTALVRQFNCGVQLGDEIAIRLPAFEDGRVEEIALRTALQRDGAEPGAPPSQHEHIESPETD